MKFPENRYGIKHYADDGTYVIDNRSHYSKIYQKALDACEKAHGEWKVELVGELEKLKIKYEGVRKELEGPEENPKWLSDPEKMLLGIFINYGDELNNLITKLKGISHE